MPAAEKVAVVEADAALPKLTVPGPLTVVHAAVGAAAPSSVTEPESATAFGRLTDLSGPALTVGAASGAVIPGTATSYSRPSLNAFWSVSLSIPRSTT